MKELKEIYYNQHQMYTSEISTAQERIDKIISEKEEISQKIEKATEEFEKLRDKKDIDPKEQVNELVSNALKDLKSKLNEKLNKKLHKIMDECSKQAAEEFAPHIQKLKTKHRSDVAVLEAEHGKEIEKIKQSRFIHTKEFLKEFEANFRKQTSTMLQSIVTENSHTLERYRQKSEKELALYESDYQRLIHSIEVQVSNIRRTNQRDIDVEKNAYERRINDCKQDVVFAKRNAEKQILQINSAKKENNEIATALPAFELEKKLNERNKVIIQRRKEELDSEVNSLKERLDSEIEDAIKNAEDENLRKKEKLKNDVEYLKEEKQRMEQLYDRYESQRVRAEKRKEASSDELTNSKNEVSRLKDRLFELNARSVPKSIKVTDYSEESNRLRSMIQDVKLEEKQKQRAFEARIKIMKENHEKALKQATEKVKSVIAAKDAQIAQLTQQLEKANNMLINATNAMQ